MTRFTVEDGPVEGYGRLMDNGVEALGGPRAELMRMAADLNEDPPPDRGQLCERIRLLLMRTRDCSFAPGPALRADR